MSPEAWVAVMFAVIFAIWLADSWYDAKMSWRYGPDWRWDPDVFRQKLWQDWLRRFLEGGR